MNEIHKVLEDDIGSVQLIQYMGSDQMVADTARVSYAGDNLKRSSDEGLIRYLMRHKHTSPFESCVVTLRLKMPIFVARQWVRHRTASMNEVSARYSILPNEVYIPAVDRVKYQSTDNKQGSGEEVPSSIATTFVELTRENARKCFNQYDFDNSQNIAKELSRINLPLNTYTEFYWTQNLHNLFHLIKLRSDSHAQWEIQQYANAIGEILRELFPISYHAFEEYVQYAVSFSRKEMVYLRIALESYMGNDDDELVEKMFSEKELKEFYNKLKG